MTKIKIIVNNQVYQEYSDNNFDPIYSIYDIKNHVANYLYDLEEFYGDGEVIVKANNLEFDISNDVADIVNEYIETSGDEIEGQKDIERAYYRGLI